LSIQSGSFLPVIANFNPDPAEYYFSATPITFDTWIRFEPKVDVAAGRAELWQQAVKEVDESGRDFGVIEPGGK